MVGLSEFVDNYLQLSAEDQKWFHRWLFLSRPVPHSKSKKVTPLELLEFPEPHTHMDSPSPTYERPAKTKKGTKRPVSHMPERGSSVLVRLDAGRIQRARLEWFAHARAPKGKSGVWVRGKITDRYMHGQRRGFLRVSVTRKNGKIMRIYRHLNHVEKT